MHAMLEAQGVFHAPLVPMAHLPECVCRAQEVRSAFLPEPPALQFAKPALQVSLALQDQLRTPTFAQQDRSAWPTAAPLHVTLVFSAQQERNLSKTTTPFALLVCTALQALLLFAAPLAPSQL